MYDDKRLLTEEGERNDFIFFQVSCEVKPVREQHLQLLQGISQVLTSVPLPYPRFFFQTLQKTTITLAILPQPRAPGDPISVQV